MIAAFLLGLGLVAGFASSFLGIGGGLVIVPALMIVSRYPIKRAVGTSLAAIVPISVVGVLTESIVKWPNIHWRTALVLTAGSLLGSWAGGKIMKRLPETPLRVAYVIFLAFAAYRMLVSAGAAAPATLPGAAIAASPAINGSAEASGLLGLDPSSALGSALTILVGILAGISSILFGIGGGIVMVPALSLLFAEFGFHAARATSLVTIVPTSAYGAWQHSRMGTVDFAAAKRLIAPGLLGAVAGVLTVNHLPARPCRIIFAAFLIFAAARLLMLSAHSLDRGGRLS